MDVSIVICAYNRAESILLTLESLERMIVPQGISWETIVVDNNSSDQTKQVVRQFANNAPLKLTYLFEKKQGKSFALNMGLRQACGKVVAFIDDVIVDRNWLSAVINAIKTYKNCNCFGGRIVSLWQGEPPRWLGTRKPYNALRGTVFERDYGVDDGEYGQSTAGETPCGANMFFRSRAVEPNGFFRTDLGPVGGVPGASEDIEFCSRMLSRGERFMYVASVIVYHPVEGRKISKRSLQKWRYYCARSEVRRKGIVRNGVCYFNVPRYLFRQLFESFLQWSLSVDAKRRFYQRLQFFWTLGEIVESYKYGKPVSALQPEGVSGRK
jgi:glycosyltransferase involved in cell wall biosynthesis